MRTIVMLGVGSTYFTKGILESMIKFGGEWDIRMVDIDETCLDIAMKLGERLVDHYKANVKLTGTTDRREVLAGADVVVSTVGVGGRKAWAKDMYLFRKYNVYQTTGDTFGASGVSRAIRTIPVLLQIAKDMEALCPEALLVNFTNPMSVNCWALNKYTSIKTIGLCYGVTFWQHALAQLIDAPFEETWCKAVGVNHFTWITQFMHKGKDAWPKVREAIANHPEKRAEDPYTWDLFDVFGAYPTVGDVHIQEFMPNTWAEGAGYGGKTLGIDSGLNCEKHLAHYDHVYDEMRAQAYGEKPLELINEDEVLTFKDEDLFIDVIMAASGEGPAVERTVNLPNNGIVPNLPDDCILEVTTLINSSGFHPYSMGKLPAGINAIVQRVTASHNLTVEAAISGDRNMVVQALMVDMVALTKEKAEEIADDIIETHKEYLPHFFNK